MGSSYFFDRYDDYKLKDNDELHIVDEFIFPNRVCMNMKLFDGNDIFIFKNTDKQEYINDVYESGVNMKVGKFLIPEFNKYINFTIDDLKSLQPIFDNMDKKHTYERVIFESYLKNGDFFLTDEQRREAYKEYKRFPSLSIKTSFVVVEPASIPKKQSPSYVLNSFLETLSLSCLSLNCLYSSSVVNKGFKG